MGQTVIVGPMGQKTIINHKVNINVEALQKRAILKYRGFLDVNMDYQSLTAPAKDTVFLEFGKLVYGTTHVLYTYQIVSDYSTLRLSWPWPKFLD